MKYTLLILLSIFISCNNTPSISPNSENSTSPRIVKVELGEIVEQDAKKVKLYPKLDSVESEIMNLLSELEKKDPETFVLFLQISSGLPFEGLPNLDDPTQVEKFLLGHPKLKTIGEKIDSLETVYRNQ